MVTFQYVVWTLLGAGVFLTVPYGFVQLRHLPEAFGAMATMRSSR